MFFIDFFNPLAFCFSPPSVKWETITFPAGIFDYGDINELIHKRIGKTGDNYGISVLFDLTTYKVFIQLANGFQIDFTKSGNFNVLLGFEKKIVSSSEYGANFPNITNSVDNLYLRCNLLSDSIISGKRSNVLYTFSTSTKTRSMPFEIQPYNYLWSKINTKTITEVTFWFTDDEDREVNLNDIDISLTVVSWRCIWENRRKVDRKNCKKTCNKSSRKTC